MYFFGDQKNNAELLVTDIAYHSGPGLPEEVNLHQMSDAHLRDTLIYRSAALRHAHIDQQDPEMLDRLLELFEEALTIYCSRSDIIWRAMRAGGYVSPINNPELVQRHIEIAESYWGSITAGAKPIRRGRSRGSRRRKKV